MCSALTAVGVVLPLRKTKGEKSPTLEMVRE